MRKQFNIKYRPQIESGEYRVETKAGCPVRIVCWDMACELPILGLVLLNDEKAEEMAVGFTNEGTNLLGEPLYDKLFIVTPEEELTEWQRFISACLQKHGLLDCGAADRIAKESAAELLSIAREQFIKDGYIIEKKTFHDAVENISDKHRAEMSVEYSLHCKVENGTRHAIMNWDTFQKVAQKFIDIGEADALKDLPRWKKANGKERFNERLIVLAGDNDLLCTNYAEEGEYYIPFSDLEKLPKEDEK